MIGTILQKPVNPEEFKAVMRWCCTPSNGARLMEYHDRYEVAARPADVPQPEFEYVEPVNIEERLDDIEARTTELEDALIEVAALLPD